MNILFLTDTHGSINKPSSRKDIDYFSTQKNKLQQIEKLIEKFDCELLLHGGDLFDRPDPDYRIYNLWVDFLMKIKSKGVMIYGIPGNHDEIGGNINLIGYTAWGSLLKSELINILTKEPINIAGITISGYPYENEISSISNLPDSDIVVVHNMILPVDRAPFEYIHPENIKTNAKYVLCGHYHYPFVYKSKTNSLFINPGSILRVKKVSLDIRKPQVVIIFTESWKHKFIELDCELNPFVEIETKEKQEIDLTSLLNNNQRIVKSFKDVVYELGSEHPELIELIMKQLDEAKKEIEV